MSMRIGIDMLILIWLQLVCQEVSAVKIDHMQILLPWNAVRVREVIVARIIQLLLIPIKIVSMYILGVLIVVLPLQVWARLAAIGQKTFKNQIIVCRLADFKKCDPRVFFQRILYGVSILHLAYLASKGFPRVGNHLFIASNPDYIPSWQPRLDTIQVHYALGSDAIARTNQRILLCLHICETKSASYWRLTLRFLRRLFFCYLLK